MTEVAIAQAVIAGASLVGTSIEQISRAVNTGRNVAIQITNYNKGFILTNPRTYCSSGYSYHPPQPTILKNTKEVCSFSKKAYTACGAVGVMTYQILRGGREHVGELAIMFSVPYDYNLYENCFALGMFEPGVKCDYDLFKRMYYGYGPFVRGKGTGSVVQFSGKDVIVKGTMSAAAQATLYVEILNKLSPYD